MTAAAAEVAGLRAELAAIAAEAARLREAIDGLTVAVGLTVEEVKAIRRHAFAQGAALHDPVQADANGRQARREFTVLAGGRAKATTKARTRQKPGGAA